MVASGSVIPSPGCPLGRPCINESHGLSQGFRIKASTKETQELSFSMLQKYFIKHLKIEEPRPMLSMLPDNPSPCKVFAKHWTGRPLRAGGPERKRLTIIKGHTGIVSLGSHSRSWVIFLKIPQPEMLITHCASALDSVCFVFIFLLSADRTSNNFLQTSLLDG